MTAEIVFVVEEAPEGGVTARALGESIFTEGDSVEDLRQNIREAVRCHFAPEMAPRVIRLHWIKEELLSA